MQKSTNISPTLIIGLGGTGSFALQYVKRKIRHRLEIYRGGPLPRQIPFIEYLVIDTTAQEEMLETFVPDEYLNIGRLNISRSLRSLDLASDYNILKWFPKKLDPGQIDSGAGGVRAIGRLCFFLNQPSIEASIRGKIDQIADSEHIKHFLNEHLSMLKMEEASTVDVHIVTSLCGGTGSACLLDTAYLVKHLVDEKLQQETNSFAHLVTPEPFEGEPGVGRTSREYIQFNFALALSEIEHFTKKDAPSPWAVEYRNGTKVHSTGKPFSVAYLLGYKDGVSLSKRQICEIIGETIALKTVHPDGRRIKGLIENYKPHVINSEDLKQKRRTYSSYNAQVLNTDVDKPMLLTAAKSAIAMILTSLCDEVVTVDMMEETFKDFEDSVFAKTTNILHLDFYSFLNRLKSSVKITPDMFGEAPYAVRNVFSLSDRKRKKESQSQAGKVNMACEEPEGRISASQSEFLSLLEHSFVKLVDATDEKINYLLGQHSLLHVHRLLEIVGHKIVEFRAALDAYKESIPSLERNYDGDIVKTIQVGTGQNIPVICAERATARMYGPVFDRLSDLTKEFMHIIGLRRYWCETAQQCLNGVKRESPADEKEVGKASHTTSTVWTKASLEQVAFDAKPRLVRKFLDLLEEHYFGVGEVNRKVCFLGHLNETLLAEQTAQALVRKAALVVLQEQIAQNEDIRRREAFDRLYEFVDLASPAWQIERMGEDIATVSITNCPEDSDSGEIIARYGKNINFSLNGNDARELILFRSEHGASVNQLINFRRCLRAVSRRMHREGKDRINDLCLDPNWNIAAPLPVEEELERLRLHFTLAILFGLILAGKESYTFQGISNRHINLRQEVDSLISAQRFEAFDKLLELDCDGDMDGAYLTRAITQEFSTRQKNENIRTFTQTLSAYRESLTHLLSEETDVRERSQLNKEIAALNKLIAENGRFIRKLGRNINDTTG